jgi:hypothetical protein
VDGSQVTVMVDATLEEWDDVVDLICSGLAAHVTQAVIPTQDSGSSPLLHASALSNAFPPGARGPWLGLVLGAVAGVVTG